MDGEVSDLSPFVQDFIGFNSINYQELANGIDETVRDTISDLVYDTVNTRLAGFAQEEWDKREDARAEKGDAE